tara:strand:- start:1310 stop:1741 length:432 start_codon:yes stop_codon:yes gene_type:complete
MPCFGGAFLFEAIMLTAILPFLSSLVSPITAVIKGKQEIHAALTKAKVDSIERGELSEIQADTEARANAGLMDDISFYVFLSPAIFAFWPPALPHIKAGFQALEGMPQWYQAALGLMLASVWGYRKLLSPIIQMLAKAYLGKK